MIIVQRLFRDRTPPTEGRARLSKHEERAAFPGTECRRVSFQNKSRTCSLRFECPIGTARSFRLHAICVCTYDYPEDTARRRDGGVHDLVMCKRHVYVRFLSKYIRAGSRYRCIACLKLGMSLNTLLNFSRCSSLRVESYLWKIITGNITAEEYYPTYRSRLCIRVCDRRSETETRNGGDL